MAGGEPTGHWHSRCPHFIITLAIHPKARASIAARKSGLIIFAGAALTDPAAIDYIDINPRSRLRTEHALALAKKINKPVVITSDADYPTLADRERFLAWDDSLKMTPQHILTKAELREALWYVPTATFNRAVSNTIAAAAAASGCRLHRAPLISVPGDLRALVTAGKAERLASGQIAWTDDTKRGSAWLELIYAKKFDAIF